MKAIVMSLVAVAGVAVASQNANACSISPMGDSRLRVLALHDVLEQDEILAGFATQADGSYRLVVQSLANGRNEVRTYQLRNTSPMCPKYQALRVN